MTNSPCIAAKFGERCPNTRDKQIHQHVRLENGRANAAEVYPLELCIAICQGFKAQMEVHRRGQFFSANIDSNSNRHGTTMAEIAKKLKKQYTPPGEDNEEEMMMAWDDVSGAALDPKKVQAARAEEIVYVRTMKLYTKVSTKECIQKTWGTANKRQVDRHQQGRCPKSKLSV